MANVTSKGRLPMIRWPPERVLADREEELAPSAEPWFGLLSPGRRVGLVSAGHPRTLSEATAIALGSSIEVRRRAVCS